MRYLQAFSNGLARIESLALAMCLLAMLGVAFFQVVMRNIYDIGYIWADILVRVLVLWVGLLGAAVATSEARHLTIDAITKFLPARLTRVIHVMTWTFALVVCVLLAQASFEYIDLQKQSNEPSVFGIPVHITEIIIPIAFVLISFHFAVLIVNGFVEIFRPTESPKTGKEVP